MGNSTKVPPAVFIFMQAEKFHPLIRARLLTRYEFKGSSASGKGLRLML